MTPDLVIFDCDGVLVDTEVILQRIDLQLVTELGWPITIDEIREHFLGRKTDQVLAAIEARLGRPVPHGWAQKRRSAYQRACEMELRTVPGVTDAIASIHASGTQTCVASSGSHQAIRHSLGLTGLWSTFEGRVFSSHDVPHPKPAPDVFLLAASNLGVEARACVVIEDSPVGVRAAHAAGMRAVGYAGRTPATMLHAAEVVIEDMSLLSGALGTTTGADE